MTAARMIAVVLALVTAGCAEEPAESASDLTVAVAPEGEEANASASLRIVNLWVDAGTGAAIDVYVKPMFGDARLLFDDVPYGSATEPADIPVDSRVTVHRADESGKGSEVGGRFLSDTDVGSGHDVTLVVTYTRPLSEGGHTAGFDLLHDDGEVVIGSMPARPVDGALLVAHVSAAMRVLGEAGEALTFGVPGEGCLRIAGSPPQASGPGAITTSVGGTAVILYDVEPGSRVIAAYGPDASRCEGAPRVGPVEVDVATAGRTWVFVYGTGPEDLRLLGVGPSPN